MERKENTNLALLIANVSVKSIFAVLMLIGIVRLWFG